ncbi:hypothetical protein RND71_026421 [Anisodus tanguticus]|uniref:Uncharacterized protein n=1 Tax=Anisodus tanguticus TaxID=243964 RepID=A0AAE1RNW2_9SOLA|nr:hypothetical protein RND71_026421 [Anisodus tanguticus]
MNAHFSNLLHNFISLIWFRLLPFRLPLLRESLLLYFPLATKLFQFARFSLAYPSIQQQFERLPYLGIS